MAPNAIGAILIGGRSTRMGTDKALVEVAGVPMVQWVAATLERIGLDVVTVGGPHRVPGHENVPDAPGLGGPLAGLAGVLAKSDGAAVVLVAVDQPLVRQTTLERLLAVDDHDAVVPMDAGHPQVTCALYRPSCLPLLRQIENSIPNVSIRDLLARAAVRYIEPAEWVDWGEDGRSWRSIDTPDDLAAIESDLVAEQVPRTRRVNDRCT
jgi:molybdopterin-guanine dinucleotide biosynthesis protein A